MRGSPQEINGRWQHSSYCPPMPTPRAGPLGVLRLVTALKRNPLECWSQKHFENPIVRGGLLIGRVIVISEPAAIRRVLLENAANYRKDRLQRRVLAAGLGKGLLSAEGERWRVQRSAVAPLFTRRAVLEFVPAMSAAALALIERWRRLEGDVIDVAAEMSRATLDVLARTIFPNGFGRDPEEIRVAMRTYFNVIGRMGVFDLLPLPALVCRAIRLQARPSLRFFEKALDEIVAARARSLAEGGAIAPNDILTRLLGALSPETGRQLSEAEVRSNLLTFISAGHETTANALTWSLFLLSQSVEWRQRVEAEVDRVEQPSSQALDRLVETRAVIDEALRLYPPIAAISRVATSDDVLAGEFVRRGTIVVIAPYVLHRHRRLWRDPDMFDPSRFLPETRSAIDRFSYLPFGAGPRICVGSAFALQEAVFMLSMIIRNFRMTLAPGHRVAPLMRVTLRPAGGLPMFIQSRR